MVETTEEGEPHREGARACCKADAHLCERDKWGPLPPSKKRCASAKKAAKRSQGAHKDMILRAARFDRLKVADVMRPRADIVAIEAVRHAWAKRRACSPKASIRGCRSTAKRSTIRRASCTCAMCMSLLAPTKQGEARAKFADRLLARISRDILFVPQSMTLATLFLKMQSSRIHLGAGRR